MKRKKKKLNVLIACEESQAECKAFRAIGQIAYSCDIQPCKRDGVREWHIQGDVTPYLRGRTIFKTMDGKRHSLKKWDLIIAHPPCTYLCKVSSVWMRQHGEIDPARFKKMLAARKFFYECLEAKADYVAVENPIPMRLAGLPKPTCYADPSWFGVKYTKKTLYWLRNLPPIMAGMQHSSPRCFVHCSRGKYRSRTFPELAEAIARQWTDYILSDDAPLGTFRTTTDNENKPSK